MALLVPRVFQAFRDQRVTVETRVRWVRKDRAAAQAHPVRRVLREIREILVARDRLVRWVLKVFQAYWDCRV